MRRNVVLHQIDSAYDMRQAGVDIFARDFDHEVKASYPILVGSIGSEMRAYAQIETRSVVTCAIHPRMNSSRDSLELARSTISFLSQFHPGFLMNAPGEPDTLFSDRIMKHFGLRPWPNRIFYYGNEG